MSAKISAEPNADEDRRQRGGKVNLPELLGRREAETAPDIDEHAPRTGEAFERLEDDRRQAGDEAQHDDGQRAATEDHQEQRIRQHERRGRHGGDPGLAGEPHQLDAMEEHAECDAEKCQQQPAARHSHAVSRKRCRCLPRQ